jgi:two-component system, OmpR family, sensor histidine kinase CpxA
MKKTARTGVTGGRRFPLYAKMLSCLLLNILLAAVVVVWLLRTHFGVDTNWLLSDTARARLQAMSTVLAAELRENPRDQWDEIVRRTGEAHGVRLGLFEMTGRQVAGDELVLAPAVAERLQSPRLPGAPPGRRRLAAGEMEPVPPHARPPPPEASRSGEPVYPKEAFRTRNPGGYWFVVRLSPPGRPPLIAVGMAERLGQTGLLFDPKPWLWSAGALLGFSFLLWFPLARSLTRSISQMTHATEEIACGRFEARVDARRRDELGRLGAAINEMTLRLNGYVAGQKRFLGDVAHELCSPLARMEVALGVLENRIPEEGERLEDVREELREMRTLVDELLAFSRRGLQASRPAVERVALVPLVNAAVQREAPGAPVQIDIPAGLAVMGVPALLQRALGNLLRNAVQHGGEESPIEVKGDAHNGTVRLIVADRGPGVPAEALAQLFDPFFRVDSSRSRETGGVGLGLAIVKSCVEECGGEVVARNREGGGFAVEMRLPGGR